GRAAERERPGRWATCSPRRYRASRAHPAAGRCGGSGSGAHTATRAPLAIARVAPRSGPRSARSCGRFRGWCEPCFPRVYCTFKYRLGQELIRRLTQIRLKRSFGTNVSIARLALKGLSRGATPRAPLASAGGPAVVL